VVALVACFLLVPFAAGILERVADKFVEGISESLSPTTETPIGAGA